MTPPILCEVCVDSLDGALAAQQAGAHRIELCGSLAEGGITPSAGLIQQVKEKVDLPVHVLIRPRGGDFYYTDAECDIMIHDITFALNKNVEGIVIGALNTDGTIDRERTVSLIQAARSASVTFHRAFDMTNNPSEALEILINLGLDRVLTSGCAASVDQGINTINNLVEQAQDRITIMPGGGINEKNAPSLIKETGVREIHFSGRSAVQSAMTFHNPALNLNDATLPPDNSRQTTDVHRVRAIIQSASQNPA